MKFVSMKSARIALLLSVESPRKVDFLLFVRRRNQLIPAQLSEQRRCEHPHAPRSCCHLSERFSLLEPPTHTHDARRRCVSAQQRLRATHTAANRDSPAGGRCGSSGLSPPRFPLKKQLFIRTLREVVTGSSRPGHGSELALALSFLPFLHLSLFFHTNFCVLVCCVVAAIYWPREVRQHGGPTESRRIPSALFHTDRRC